MKSRQKQNGIIMIFRLLVKFSLIIMGLIVGFTTQAQQTVEPKSIRSLVFLQDDYANGLFNIHYDDLTSTIDPKLAVSTVIDNMPELDPCSILSVKAQDNFIKPPQPITDESLEELTSEILSFTVEWQCQERPNSIDATKLIEVVPSVEYIYVLVIDETTTETPEISVQLSRAQATAGF